MSGILLHLIDNYSYQGSCGAYFQICNRIQAKWCALQRPKCRLIFHSRKWREKNCSSVKSRHRKRISDKTSKLCKCFARNWCAIQQLYWPLMFVKWICVNVGRWQSRMKHLETSHRIWKLPFLWNSNRSYARFEFPKIGVDKCKIVHVIKHKLDITQYLRMRESNTFRKCAIV